jgi:hypothetical protein
VHVATASDHRRLPAMTLPLSVWTAMPVTHPPASIVISVNVKADDAALWLVTAARATTKSTIVAMTKKNCHSVSP